MNANTCSNTLTLPVHSKYLDYNLFQEEFTTCILDSPGFGNVQLVCTLSNFVTLTEGIQVCRTCILNKQLFF